MFAYDEDSSLTSPLITSPNTPPLIARSAPLNTSPGPFTNPSLVLLLFLHAFFCFTFLGVRDATTIWGGVKASHGGLGMSSAELGDLSGYINLPIILMTGFVIPKISDCLGCRNAGILGLGLSAIFTIFIPMTKLVLGIHPPNNDVNASQDPTR
jgi:hypothetical protein